MTEYYVHKIFIIIWSLGLLLISHTQQLCTQWPLPLPLLPLFPHKHLHSQKNVLGINGCVFGIQSLQSIILTALLFDADSVFCAFLSFVIFINQFRLGRKIQANGHLVKNKRWKQLFCCDNCLFVYIVHLYDWFGCSARSSMPNELKEI